MWLEYFIPHLVLPPLYESESCHRVVESLQVPDSTELERLAPAEFDGVVPISQAANLNDFHYQTVWPL